MTARLLYGAALCPSPLWWVRYLLERARISARLRSARRTSA
jgi:hypothetical protein